MYIITYTIKVIFIFQKFPKEDLAAAIGNVFDFDRYSKEMSDTLLEVLHSSGLPTQGVLEGRSEAAKKKLQVTIDRHSGYVFKGIYFFKGMFIDCICSTPRLC